MIYRGAAYRVHIVHAVSRPIDSATPIAMLHSNTRTDSLRRHISIRGGTKTWTGKITQNIPPKKYNKMNNRNQNGISWHDRRWLDLNHRLFFRFHLTLYCFGSFFSLFLLFLQSIGHAIAAESMGTHSSPSFLTRKWKTKTKIKRV